MLKFYLMVYSLLFCVSCARTAYKSKSLNIQTKEFKLYVQMFEKESRLYGKGVVIDNLIVRFADIPQDEEDGLTVLGVCQQPYDGSTPIIEIDSKEWKKLSQVRRKVLMYHELGHCVLDRSHVDRGDFHSIMNPKLLSKSDYIGNSKYYLKELFGERND